MACDSIPPGVLNSTITEKLEKSGVLSRSGGKRIDVGESALDLHLSDSGWHLSGSVKQIQRDKSVPKVCEEVGGTKVTIPPNGRVLGRGKVYVFKLQESVDFRQYPFLYGEATGKSSIGRLDILTRLLANSGESYDSVPNNYRGPLYIEIIPISFPVRVGVGVSLNQLRIHCGLPQPLSNEQLIGRRLLFQGKRGASLAKESQSNGVLTLNLEKVAWGRVQACALVLKSARPTTPFSLLPGMPKVNPHSYFRPVAPNDNHIHIKKDHFYILRSRERLLLPKDIAVTGEAYTEQLGEVRIHYAGFAHPRFGMYRSDKKVGAPLIFEVRAHNFDVILRDRERFATIKFYRMSEPCPMPDPQSKVAAYSEQELTLSKYFNNP